MEEPATLPGCVIRLLRSDAAAIRIAVSFAAAVVARFSQTADGYALVSVRRHLAPWQRRKILPTQVAKITVPDLRPGNSPNEAFDWRETPVHAGSIPKTPNAIA